MAAHPWFEPLHRRVLVTLLCAGWLAFEAWYAPGGLWFWLALAAVAYALWDFFLSGHYRAVPERRPSERHD